MNFPLKSSQKLTSDFMNKEFKYQDLQHQIKINIASKMSNTQQVNDQERTTSILYGSNPKHCQVFSSTLSNIIQTSNEGSSNINDQQNSNNLKQIDCIPEQRSEQSSPFIHSRKTYNFEPSVDLDSPKRRTQTLDQKYQQIFPNYNENIFQDTEQNKREFQDQQFQGDMSKNFFSQPSVKLKRRLSYKIILLFVMCFALIQFINIVLKNKQSSSPLPQKGVKSKKNSRKSAMKIKKRKG